jgi:hypothetical protein
MRSLAPYPGDGAMCFSVSSDLHYCSKGEDFVFLSLRTDRYFLLRGPPSDRFRRFLAGSASAYDIDWLVCRRLIVPGGESSAGFAAEPIAAPRSSILEGPLPNVGITALAVAIGAQRTARRDLSRRGLGDIIGELASAKGKTLSPDIEINRTLAAAFQRARRYAPAIDQCLVRGVAMRRLFHRRRLEARLVIGVTMPFSAHCWVQVGDAILTDPLDLVLPFQPILAV